MQKEDSLAIIGSIDQPITGHCDFCYQVPLSHSCNWSAQTAMVGLSCNCKCSQLATLFKEARIMPRRLSLDHGSFNDHNGPVFCRAQVESYASKGVHSSRWTHCRVSWTLGRRGMETSLLAVPQACSIPASVEGMSSVDSTIPRACHSPTAWHLGQKSVVIPCCEPDSPGPSSTVFRVEVHEVDDCGHCSIMISHLRWTLPHQHQLL